MDELDALDLAVAKAEGITVAAGAHWRPSRDAVEAMRLLVKYRLCVEPAGAFTEWRWVTRWTNGHFKEVGPTPAIAICKAVVAIAAEKEGGR